MDDLETVVFGVGRVFPKADVDKVIKKLETASDNDIKITADYIRNKTVPLEQWDLSKILYKLS